MNTPETTYQEYLQAAVVHVNAALFRAAEHGLQAEVMAAAMLYYGKYPEEGIRTALDVALYEWDV